MKRKLSYKQRQRVRAEIEKFKAEVKAKYDSEIKIKLAESHERLYNKGIINFDQYELLMSRLFLKDK
jgi:hypothetical protein